MKVREIKGLYHCVTLADKTTFRLLPRQTKEVKDNQVSKELRDLEDAGEVMLISTPKVAPPTQQTKKEDEGGKK